MLKATVVRNKKDGSLVPFTTGRFGEIIITSSKEYNWDDLIVSLVDPEELKEVLGDDPDNNYFVLHGQLK